MERRDTESALKQLCGRIGVEYTTEKEFVEGAWFLATIGQSKVAIVNWGHHNGQFHYPLGDYGYGLTHHEAYERCWFADRCFDVAIQRARIMRDSTIHFNSDGTEPWSVTHAEERSAP